MPREYSSPCEDDRSNPTGGREHIFHTSRSQPLVIVAEGGRHDEASRRVVRAQAARASAAQSRLTRARNREERESRDGPQSPSGMTGTSVFQANVQPSSSSARSTPPQPMSPPSDSRRPKPLMGWLGTMPSITGVGRDGYQRDANVMGGTERPEMSSGAPSSGSPSHGLRTDTGRQLPMAVPRGFAQLGQRVDMSGDFVKLISRTACFDFGSPGVESRLHMLLSDLISSSAGASMANMVIPGHPVQAFLRIACTCLTIFQGQRADGQTFADDPKYNAGLGAAWAEVLTMDQAALTEPKTAQVSLWAIFIISVTTGADSTVRLFHSALHNLMSDLNLKGWIDVRTTLLEFIFPVSFLDEPCRRYYDGLQQLRIGLV